MLEKLSEAYRVESARFFVNTKDCTSIIHESLFNRKIRDKNKEAKFCKRTTALSSVRPHSLTAKKTLTPKIMRCSRD